MRDFHITFTARPDEVPVFTDVLTDAILHKTQHAIDNLDLLRREVFLLDILVLKGSYLQSFRYEPEKSCFHISLRVDSIDIAGQIESDLETIDGNSTV